MVAFVNSGWYWNWEPTGRQRVNTGKEDGEDEDEDVPSVRSIVVQFSMQSEAACAIAANEMCGAVSLHAGYSPPRKFPP